MTALQNPFHELYLTESVSPERFIQIFSPFMVGDALSLFQAGNVVLMGIQGSGKSALLNLLKPEQRIAYLDARDDENPFPVPEPFSKFISGGINITRSGAIDFGQRPMEDASVNDVLKIPAYFGDFLNYWIVRDIFRSYSLLAAHPRARQSLSLLSPDNTTTLDAFSQGVANRECWSGYLKGVSTIGDLLSRIDGRILNYRDFLNYNVDSVDAEIQRSKTSAGEPISVFVETMREFGLIPAELPVFVRIDQYEELSRLEDWSATNGLYASYKGVVNKMIGSRDPRISYRIGTRRHAWDEAPRMYGTSTVIEELRNYRILDIDELLRRKENRPWQFPRFAEDVFKRRARAFSYQTPKKKTGFIRHFFGKTLLPAEVAMRYVRSNPDGIVQAEDDWPDEFKVYLRKLAATRPLDARLAESWIRQKYIEPIKDFDLDGWRSPHKRWWVKERIDQALVQIAASKRQKLLWAGEDDVLHLSGANILVFVSICQFTWDAWLRTAHKAISEEKVREVPMLDDVYIQDEGIQQASAYWFRKLRADPSGDSRQRFISVIGNIFRQRLVADRRMSYPGENGFTLSRAELDAVPVVERFLFDAAAFGALYDRRHTPKSRSRGESIKWYLNPILSAYFQLPVGHTKEPYYARVAEVADWLKEAKAIVFSDAQISDDAKVDQSGQRSLFDE